jgi:hypothetical protein
MTFVIRGHCVQSAKGVRLNMICSSLIGKKWENVHFDESLTKIQLDWWICFEHT